MSRKTYVVIAASVVLALFLVVNYTGIVPGKKGVGGTLSCSSPTGPGESNEKEYSPETLPPRENEVAVEFLVGPIYYAEEIGGEKWRAGFEVKAYFPSGRDITKKSDITFYTMQKAIMPSPDDDWISIDSNNYGTGLLLYEGEWSDREGSSDPTIWVRAHIRIPEYDIDTDLIAQAAFRESVERPTTAWGTSRELHHGSGERILDSAELRVH
jgi:hypothetical protein